MAAATLPGGLQGSLWAQAVDAGAAAALLLHSEHPLRVHLQGSWLQCSSTFQCPLTPAHSIAVCLKHASQALEVKGRRHCFPWGRAVGIGSGGFLKPLKGLGCDIPIKGGNQILLLPLRAHPKSRGEGNTESQADELGLLGLELQAAFSCCRL